MTQDDRVTRSRDAVDRALVLFTKPAIPGRVKTRLIGRLRPEQSAALHQAFLDDALARLTGGEFTRFVAWALEGTEAVPTAPEGWTSQRQVGADLGARLHHALAHAATTHRYVAAIGSDHPELSTALVETAFRRLEDGADVVLGPAADGGYYLIAMTREALAPDLFDGIAWSTDTVYTATRTRVLNRDLTLSDLPLGHDVDDAEGLDRLADRLRRDQVVDVPRTRALLASWGLCAPLTEGTT